MTEPRKTPRTDMELSQLDFVVGDESAGEWVTYKGAEYNDMLVTEVFARALEVETQELADAASLLLDELDEEARLQIGDPDADIVFDHVPALRDLIARHRAKQEGGK